MDVKIGQQLWKFNGGLKLRHWKKLSTDRPLTFAGIPDKLILPVTQHQGDEANPLVKIGDRVLKGQLLAAGENPYCSANLHAPTSGTVTAIKPADVIHESGLPDLCIEIVPDGKDEAALMPAYPDWQALDRETLMDIVTQAGIVGLGGAVFPTHRKLDHSLDTLIVNGAECEPYIACDESLMRNDPALLVKAAQMMGQLNGARQIVIAVEDQMGAVELLLNRARDELDIQNVCILKVPTVYPEGGERQLIQVLTGQEVPADGYPSDMGILCLNVGTVVSAYRAVTEGRPLISRVVTLTGRGISEPQNFEALLGTPISYLVEKAGGYTEGAERLVVGGPMMGIALPHDEFPVSKNCNAVLALIEKDIQPTAPEVPCIRCMDCVTACPAQLLPQQLYWHIKNKDYTQTQQHGIFDCIECGCCAYVCPSQIPLVDYYRHAKSEICAQSIATERAAQAKLRYEARTERLARQDRRLNRKLKEKQQSLSGNRDASAAIQAAVARAKAKKQADQS